MKDDGYNVCISTDRRFGVLYADWVDVMIEMSADLNRGWNFAHFSIVYVDVTTNLLQAENWRSMEKKPARTTYYRWAYIPIYEG